GMLEAKETVVRAALNIGGRHRVAAKELQALLLVRIPGGGETVDIGEGLGRSRVERPAAPAVRRLDPVDGRGAPGPLRAEVRDLRDAAPGKAEVLESRAQSLLEALPLGVVLAGEVGVERSAEEAAQLIGGVAGRTVAIHGTHGGRQRSRWRWRWWWRRGG